MNLSRINNDKSFDKANMYIPKLFIIKFEKKTYCIIQCNSLLSVNIQYVLVED